MDPKDQLPEEGNKQNEVPGTDVAGTENVGDGIEPGNDDNGNDTHPPKPPVPGRDPETQQ